MGREFDPEDFDRAQEIADLDDMPSSDREELQRSPHLAYVVLFSRDVEELAEFYETLFQFPRNYQTGSTVEFQAGSVVLSLTDTHQMVDELGLSSVPTNPEGHSGVSFLVENVDEVYEAALALGAETVSAPRDTEWGMRSAWLRDPSGHLIELGRWIR